MSTKDKQHWLPLSQEELRFVQLATRILIDKCAQGKIKGDKFTPIERTKLYELIEKIDKCVGEIK